MKWRHHWIKKAAWCCGLIAGALCLAAAGVAAAATPASDVSDLKKLSIEELMEIEVETVTSASKYEQKVTEAPSSVTVLKAEDIRRYGYRTLGDILQSIRGVSVAYDRDFRSVGVRGFGRPGDFNSHVLLMVDGHRMNDNVYDKAPIGNDFILDVDLIDRVEISRGPSSSLYGSNAFFAVVNVITRRGKDLGGGEVSGEVASFNTVKGRLSYGKEWQRAGEGIASATGYDSKGDRLYFSEFDPANPFHDPRAGNQGIAQDRDGERSGSFFAKWSSRGFTLEGALISREKDIPTAANGSDFNNPGNRTTAERSYVDARYDSSIGQQADVAARIYVDSSEYSRDDVYSGIVNQDRGSGTDLGGELQLSGRFAERHRVVAGATYEGNLRQDQSNTDQIPFISYLSDERRSRSWAAYLQDEVIIVPSLVLNAGIRYDQTCFSGGTTNPRIALILTPAQGSTVKFLYGSAFRSPSVYELYYRSPASSPPVVSNPELKPEKIKTYETVYEQYFASGVRTTIDGYYYRIDDLIDQMMNATGDLVFGNIEEVEARGLELELEKRFAGGAEGSVNYALQRATNTRTGDVLTNSPEHLGKMKIALPFVNDRFLAGIEEQYTSDRKTSTGRYLGNLWITNLTLLGRNVARTVEVSAGVYNLFGRSYSNPAPPDLIPITTVPQDGRTVRFKVTYAF